MKKAIPFIIKQKSYWYFAIIGICMSFFCVSCELLERNKNVEWNVCSVLCVCGLSIVCGLIIGWGMYGLLTRNLYHRRKDDIKVNKVKPLDKRKTIKYFLIVWAIVSAVYLPVYLAYFPGICTYDFPIQLEQILSGTFNEHHPLIHTLLLSLFLKMGNVFFHSATAGIGAFLLIQMLLLSSGFAFAVTALRQIGLKKSWQIGMILYAAIYPFHWYLGISTTKDVEFAILLLYGFVLLLYILKIRKNTWKPSALDIIFVAVMSLAGMFRNNAPYAFLLMLGVVIICIFISENKKFYARLAIMTLLSVLLAMGGNSLLKAQTNAVQGDRREMLSVWIQQTARVMYYHRDEMDEETIELVQKAIWEPGLMAYRPEISDPVKSQTVTYEIKNNAAAYLKLYGKWLVNYPSDMVNAVLALDAGYLNPLDRTHYSINMHDSLAGLGYVQTFFGTEANAQAGIEQKSILPAYKSALDLLADSNILQRIPAIRLLFSPGVYLWAFLYMLGLCLFSAKIKVNEVSVCSYRRYSICCVLAIAYILSLLFGPTVQLRYLYPVMILLPIFVAFVFGREED